MKNDVVIKVEKLSKKYQIGTRESYLTLRDRLVELPKKIFKKEKKKEFWALKNVSFEIKRGEVVGVIGRNGAGKSTLLKILARITEPTSGKITMKGRVASMLEVGTGFNPELTGRENIYLNGSILGMSRAEIESKFKEIVEFSGVDKFLDTPVKHYSSGMYVRLAFAVAAHLDSDILLVDEVLAVGDTEFQKKCLGKMSDLSQSGRTILLVTHNMVVVSQICTKVIICDQGMIQINNTYSSNIKTNLLKYQSYESKIWKPIKHINTSLTIRKIQLINKSVLINDNIFIETECKVTVSEKNAALVGILYYNGIEVFRTYDTDDNPKLLRLRDMGIVKYRISIPKDRLKSGVYEFRVYSAILNKDTILDPGGSIRFIINGGNDDTSLKSYSVNRTGLIRSIASWEII